MGLFSSKTKISVSSVTINLGNEDVDAGKYDALIYAIFQGTSIIKSILNFATHGMGAKVRAAYNYAKSYYTLGLPEGDDGIAIDGTFLPVIPLRYNNADLTAVAVRGTPLYLTSKKLLKKLSMDINALGDAINTNPDVDEIDHAYIMFGVQLQTKNNESIRYLTEYFHHAAQSSQYNKYDFIDYAANRLAGIQNSYSFINLTGLQNNEAVHLTEHGLNIKIQYTFINSRIKSGVIGKIGTATSETYIGQVAVYVPVEPSPEMMAYWYAIHGVYPSTDPEMVAVYVDGSHITFRLQLTATTYREVQVYGLSHYNFIYDGHYFSTSLAESLDPENHNFVIPIHYGVAQRLPSMKRTILYKDSLRLVLNSFVKTKVKWYQSGIFKIFAFAVALVVVYFSWGTLSSFVLGAIAALEVSFLALIMYVLPGIMLSLVMGYVASLVTDLVGPELSAILGVVLAVYAISQVKVGAINFFTGQTTAQTCLSASSALLDASMGAIKESIANVQEEMSMFAMDSEIKWKSLETATDLLDSRSTLNPLALLTPPQKKLIINESPGDFYDRTIHMGNIGVVSLDMATYYYDIMLRLPKVQYS